MARRNRGSKMSTFISRLNERSNAKQAKPQPSLPKQQAMKLSKEELFELENNFKNAKNALSDIERTVYNRFRLVSGIYKMHHDYI